MLVFAVSLLAVPVVPSSSHATALLQASNAGASLSGSTLPGSVPAAAVACAWRNSNMAGLIGGNLSTACNALVEAGWELTESYNLVQEGTGDTDNLDVHTKDGDCLLGMHGDDYSELGFVGYNCAVCNGSFADPITYNGVDGVMGMVADETETLLNAIRAKHGSLGNWTATVCTGKLYTAGHSSGGGIAALIAYLANLPEDPLAMKKHVDEVYTFGTATYFKTPLNNSLTADGCFKGMAYYARVPEGADPGYGTYGDPSGVTMFPGFGYGYLVPLPYMSLDMTSSTAFLGPVVSTPCGSKPAVYAEMGTNVTLLNRANAQKILAFGATIGTHEPMAAYNSLLGRDAL